MDSLLRGHRRTRLGAAVALSFALVGLAMAASVLGLGFGKDGVAEVPMPAEEREGIDDSSQGPLIRDLAVGPGSGLTVAIGSGTSTGYFGAARFRPDGTLDRSFSDDGFVQAWRLYPRLRAMEAQGVAVQRDGKTVLVGYRVEGGADFFAPVLMRLLPDGRPDSSFGRQGLLASRLSKGARSDALHSVAIEASGRIIVVGGRNERYHSVPPRPRPAALVAAYRPNGRLDRSFGNRGRVLFFGLRHYATTLFDVSVLPGGQLLVTGYRNNRLFVAKLNADGRLDRGFGGGDGKVSVDLDRGKGCCPVAASQFSLDDGSSLVLADGYSSVLMIRLRPNGGLDRSFGRHGTVKRNHVLPEVHDVAVQGDGRIVVVGVGGRRRLVFKALRFLPNGRPDRRFGKGGVLSLPLGRNSFGTSAVTLPSGRVVAGGGAQYRRGDRLEYSLLLARLRG